MRDWRSYSSLAYLRSYPGSIICFTLAVQQLLDQNFCDKNGFHKTAPVKLFMPCTVQAWFAIEG